MVCWFATEDCADPLWASTIPDPQACHSENTCGSPDADYALVIEKRKQIRRLNEITHESDRENFRIISGDAGRAPRLPHSIHRARPGRPSGPSHIVALSRWP